MKWISDNWPDILASLAAFCAFAYSIQAATKKTKWKWDDPIGDNLANLADFFKAIISFGKAKK